MTRPIYAVTLSALREARACYEGYNKVVRMIHGESFSEEDDERESYIHCAHVETIPLVDIANNNGIDDALWTLRCIPGCDRDARLFAVWCARQVEHLMTDQRSKDALDVAERFSNGEATDAERAAAWAAAWAAERAAERDAARAAARDAARDAARAAAWDAAEAAAWDAARDAQLEMFIAMCEGRAPWQTKTAALCG